MSNDELSKVADEVLVGAMPRGLIAAVEELLAAGVSPALILGRVRGLGARGGRYGRLTAQAVAAYLAARGGQGGGCCG